MLIESPCFDHPKIGSGFRRALVVRRGPKWVKLIYVATGMPFTMKRPEFDRLVKSHRTRVLETPPRGTMTRIKRNRAAFRASCE